ALLSYLNSEFEACCIIRKDMYNKRQVSRHITSGLNLTIQIRHYAIIHNIIQHNDYVLNTIIYNHPIH
uniref:Uncharacterized protein n=1 Tax=Oryza brachyantha TaxID=4533 RepID=J3LF59_ORYBR